MLDDRLARLVRDGHLLVVGGERQLIRRVPRTADDATRVLPHNRLLLERTLIVEQQVALCGADGEQRLLARPAQVGQVLHHRVQ